MALIKCGECGKEISDKAGTCPGCGAPVASAPASTPTPPPSPTPPLTTVSPAPARAVKHSAKTSPLRVVLLLILLFLVAAIAYSVFISQDKRDAINLVAKATGVSAVIPVIPWIERADTAARVTIQEKSANAIASTIQGLTHPSADSPVLKSVSTKKMGDTLFVDTTVGYSGGFSGNSYEIVVRWTLTETQNLGVQILRDTSPVTIADRNMKALADYYQQNVYPVVLANAR